MKNKVFYPRTYRHLKNDNLKSGIYLFFMVVLPIFLMGKYLGEFTNMIAKLGVSVLSRTLPEANVEISKVTFSFLGNISFINVEALATQPYFLGVQIVLTAILILFFSNGKRAGMPFALFCVFELSGYLINCLFFFFWPHSFPYGISDFSQLYIKQQLGIWLAFLAIYGISTAFLGERGYQYKVISSLLFAMYSFIFGVLRYILFLYILSKYSTLYMYIMYFTLGPLFDFLYMVEFYGILVNKLIKIYDSSEGKTEWQWY